MADMLPQEIAEQLKPMEFVDLCTYVSDKYNQKFGVISVERIPPNIRTKKGELYVTVELADDTQHRIRL